MAASTVIALVLIASMRLLRYACALVVPVACTLLTGPMPEVEFGERLEG